MRNSSSEKEAGLVSILLDPALEIFFFHRSEDKLPLQLWYRQLFHSLYGEGRLEEQPTPVSRDPLEENHHVQEEACRR